jgi:hypothetical protein
MFLIIVFMFVSSLTWTGAFVAADGDDDHEPELERDEEEDVVWLRTGVISVRLESRIPSFEFWNTMDDNGSRARFGVSYLMIVEFEDNNGDGVYQPEETIVFAPLDAFEWIIQTGEVMNDSGVTTEAYASYTKGALSDEDWDDDWFEDWIPGYDPDEIEDEDSYFSQFEDMTLQFYSRLYLNDYSGTVEDDEGVKATYTVDGGTELKIDIEIGNFPFVSNTSKVAVLNYLQEDLASDGAIDHILDVLEDEYESEDEWDDDLGKEYEDDDEDDDENEEVSFVSADTNTTIGFYRWVDEAIMALPNTTVIAFDVEASFWTNGEGMLLFFAYPNFDGGSLIHDPSLGLVEDEAITTTHTTTQFPPIPPEILVVAVLFIVAVTGVGLAFRRR